MSDDVHGKYELEAAISKLDHTSYGCRLQIADIRRQMDVSCDRGVISLYQWRSMMEALGEIQAKCATVDPNAGWNLPRRRAQ